MDHVKKISTSAAKTGDRGQKLLAAGQDLAMRMWQKPPTSDKDFHTHDYEVVGYVVKGRAKIHTDGGVVELGQGDSWVVPAGVGHRYEILEDLVAVEAVAKT